jgi:hypothetical protein
MGGIKKIIVVAFLICLCFDIHSQEYTYDVSNQGKPVGNMLLTLKELDSGKVYYSAVMDLEYKLFRPTQMVQLQEAVYQNDTLIQAYFIEKRNGEVVEESKIERLQERKYYTTTRNGNKDWHDKPVLNSLLKVYFNQPNKRDSAFSEVTHQYIQIAKLPEENRYMMVSTEGEKSIFEYNKEGICIKKNFNNGAVEYEIKLSDSPD